MPPSVADVEFLRSEMNRCGIRLTKTQAFDVLVKVGNRHGLAVDALLLLRRPDWLAKLVPEKKASREPDDASD